MQGHPGSNRTLFCTLSVVFISVLLIVTGMEFVTFAYDSDTHFILTYYIARQVGFTRTEALRIARADVGMDEKLHIRDDDLIPTTAKLEKPDSVVACLGYKVVASIIYRELVSDSNCRNKNVLWHAFRDAEMFCIDVTLCDIVGNAVGADNAIQSRKTSLSTRACTENKFKFEYFGQFLHYLQDSFAHRGFWSIIGQAKGGVLPDYLGYVSPSVGGWPADQLVNGIPGKTQDMFDATVQYMTNLLTQNTCGLSRIANQVTLTGAARNFVIALINANPVPSGVLASFLITSNETVAMRAASPSLDAEPIESEYTYLPVTAAVFPSDLRGTVAIQMNTGIGLITGSEQPQWVVGDVQLNPSGLYRLIAPNGPFTLTIEFEMVDIQGANLDFTAAHGVDLSVDLYDWDPFFDDLLDTTKANVANHGSLTKIGPVVNNISRWKATFSLQCKAQTLIGPSGSSGEGTFSDPAEVYFVIHTRSPENYVRIPYAAVRCLKPP